jgi:hypothetical protein
VAVFGVVALAAAACSDTDDASFTDTPDQTTIRVPQDAIDALERYRFTTQLDVTSAETDLHVTFDGAFEKPDRIQGTVAVRGMPYEQYIVDLLKRPATSELIVIGDVAWWRAPDGDWQPGIEGYETTDPFVTLRQYATPEFYLEALRFDALDLTIDGRERVNGADTVRVRLDKAAIVALVPQGTGIRLYPDPDDQHSFGVLQGVAENAQQVLPEDFVVQVWFADDTMQPVRIAFDYRVTDADYSNLSWGFGVPMELRMQLDITDPDADVDIGPPPGFTVETPAPEPTTDVPPATPRPAITRSQ